MSKKTPVHKKKWIRYVSIRRSKWIVTRLFMWWYHPKVVDIYYLRYGVKMLNKIEPKKIYDVKCQGVEFKSILDLLTFRIFYTRMKG